MLLDTRAGTRAPARSRAGLPRIQADPRSKLLLLVVCNVLAMGLASTTIVLAIAVVVGILVVLDEPPRRVVAYTVTVAVLWAGVGLPLLRPSGLTLLLGTISYWLLRFAVTLSLGAWFVTTVRVSDLLASMSQIRLPRFLVIPFSVLFRFLPVAIDEARGVMEAMQLRGYSRSYLWRHPLDCVEKLVVPVLTASARSADELSAAALIRGLGAGGRPTVVDPLRLRGADVVLIVLAVALACLPLWEGRL